MYTICLTRDDPGRAGKHFIFIGSKSIGWIVGRFHARINISVHKIAAHPCQLISLRPCRCDTRKRSHLTCIAPVGFPYRVSSDLRLWQLIVQDVDAQEPRVHADFAAISLFVFIIESYVILRTTF
jgi:hypothetical protein